MTAYSVVELVQESGRDKTIDNNILFAKREDALEYIMTRYNELKEIIDKTTQIFNEEYSEDGWYEIADKEDNIYECYISDCLTIRGIENKE